MPRYLPHALAVAAKSRFDLAQGWQWLDAHRAMRRVESERVARQVLHLSAVPDGVLVKLSCLLHEQSRELAPTVRLLGAAELAKGPEALVGQVQALAQANLQAAVAH